MNLEDIFNGPPSPSRWRELGRWLRSTRVIPGVGIRTSIDASGTILSAKPHRRSAGGGETHHPYKMSVREVSSELRLFMHAGIVEFPAVIADSSSSQVPYWRAESPLWDGTTNGLTGNPDGTTEGSAALAASTTYGVWLKVKMAPGSAPLTNTNAGLSPPTGDQWYLALAYTPGQLETPTVVVSNTATERFNGPALVGATAGYGYFYIGKVTTDGDGGATILQYRSSDLTLPPFSMAETFHASGDSGNLLTLGSDGRVMLDNESVVTSITGGNLIVATDDGDGHWTVEIEDGTVMTSVSGGTDISTTDNGGGDWTVSYTGT